MRSSPKQPVPAAHGRGLVAVVLVVCAAASVTWAGDAPASVAVHGVSAARAAVIRDHAEHVRQRVFAEIMGQERPPAWAVPCDIHVHETAASFSAAVGGPPAMSRGATSIEFAGEDVSLRRIDVMGDGEGPVPDALAHELVHVVLADHFTAGPPPRWADEGLAVLYDAADKQSGHEADFQAARRGGQTWSTAGLLALENYPEEPGRQRVFYGQSAALVRWLINRRDSAVFLRFIDDCQAQGEAEALDRHYGFSSMAALDRAWLAVPSDSDLGVD